MTDYQLLSVLRNIDLQRCEDMGNNIFYIRKYVTTKYFDCYSGKDKHSRSLEEFLVIANYGIKQGIIHNCNNDDLHWYVFSHWRNKSVLSNALRTGIIKRVWPDIEAVSCCYNWDDDKVAKRQKTEYLAGLAGLGVKEETTCWISPR